MRCSLSKEIFSVFIKNAFDSVYMLTFDIILSLNVYFWKNNQTDQYTKDQSHSSTHSHHIARTNSTVMMVFPCNLLSSLAKNSKFLNRQPTSASLTNYGDTRCRSTHTHTAIAACSLNFIAARSRSAEKEIERERGRQRRLKKDAYTHCCRSLALRVKARPSSIRI